MASSAQDSLSSTRENGTENSNGDKSLTDIDSLKDECLKWKTKSEKLQTELDDTKSEVTVANCIKVIKSDCCYKYQLITTLDRDLWI